MSLRRWMREHVLGGGTDGNSGTGRNTVARALGEYDAQSYPVELTELLQRRAMVLDEFMRIDVTAAAARVEAIPRLKELLRDYPHSLIYETLIHAYLDSGRFDEARGVAFAARERRDECTNSPHPEIQSEIDGLREWSPDDVDALREERLPS